MRSPKLEKPSSNNSQKKEKFFIPAIAIVGGLFLLLIAFWIATRPTPTPHIKSIIERKTLSKQQIDNFFDTYVHPALDEFQKNNEQAVNKAVERISNEIDSFRQGIPEFIEDITSWGTRFGVLRRLGSDYGEKWWGDPNNANHTEEYIKNKFNQYIFSEYELESLIKNNLQQFHDDIIANQNKLHSKIIEAWKKAGFQSDYNLDLNKIVADTNKYALAICKNSSIDSLTMGVVSEIGGFILGEATESLVRRIFLRIGTQMANSVYVSTLVESSATAEGAIAGGTGGSSLGPVGTVCGIAAGIIVGIVADWWMTDKLKQKLDVELNDMISNVKYAILVGTDEAPGLRDEFIKTIDILNKAEKQALLSNMQEAVQ